jgi:hypothetical protein
VDTIGMQAGERLQAEGTLGVVVYNELIRLIAGLHEWADLEHHGDGSHGDVTADSIVAGAITVDELTVSDLLTVNDEAVFAGPVTIINGELHFGGDTAAWSMWKGAAGVIYARMADDSDYVTIEGGAASFHDALTVQRTADNVQAAFVSNYHATGKGLYIHAGSATKSVLYAENVSSVVAFDVLGNGNATFAGTINERARTTALGEWIAVTFAAGNFTGTGAQTWTLTAPDQANFAYTLYGKTMTAKFQLATTSVGGVAATGLQILIPGGFTAASVAYNAAAFILDNGVLAAGRLSVAAGGTKILVERSDGAVWTAAANTTYVYGQITIEVQ